MKRAIVIFIIIIISFVNLFAEEGRYQWVYNETTYESTHSGLTGATATAKAVISASVLPSSYIEIGFSKSNEIGNYYVPESDNLYSSSISLEDSVSDLDKKLDGIATGPDDLYVYYKVINASYLNIIVSLSDDLSNGVNTTIPWEVTLIDNSNGNNRKTVTSNEEVKEVVLYPHVPSTTYSKGVFKTEIRTVKSYESNSSEIIPVGDYTANLKVEVRMD